MWCYPERWLDGGVLGRTSPFRQMRVVPQMTPYHKNCLVSEWCSSVADKEIGLDG